MSVVTRALRRSGMLMVVVAVLCVSASPASAATRVVDDSSACPGATFTTIQAAIDAADPNDTISVCAGVYFEDVTVNKTLTIVSTTGAGATAVSGPSGGGGATFQVSASNVVIDGFTITREGNSVATWNDPLNSAGVAFQGISGGELRNSLVAGNRTAVDINNASGVSIHNNSITDNRTGILLRNTTENTSVYENFITDNWTIGVLFIDGSGGNNAPAQSAAGSTFTNNDISDNWYGQVEDRQTGGSLPTPGNNRKDFSGNWLGTTNPTTSTTGANEPPYGSQIPVAHGGTAVPPVPAEPDVKGTASANIDFTPLLESGTDTDANEFGFQGNFNALTVTTAGAQVGSAGRITEGATRVNSGGVVHPTAALFAESVSIDKPNVTIDGVSNTTTIIDPTSGNGVELLANADGTRLVDVHVTGAPRGINVQGVQVDNVALISTRVSGNTNFGIEISNDATANGWVLNGVVSTANNTGMRVRGSATGMTIVNSQFNGNQFGLYSATKDNNAQPDASRGNLTGLTVTNSQFNDNVQKGMYFEVLRHALFDEVTVQNSGTGGPSPIGIDVNLKFADFVNIAFEDSTITSTGTPAPPATMTGLAVKARNDQSGAGYQLQPASLSTVRLERLNVTNMPRGIDIGNNVSSVQMHRNNITGTSGYGLKDYTSNGTDQIDAECNYWGSATGPGGQGDPAQPGGEVGVGPGTGTRIFAATNSGGVDFTPWLTAAAPGGACNGPIVVAPPADTDSDGLPDSSDNCDAAANADQADGDGDGVGDACDPANGNDPDGDGDQGSADNCPNDSNADQANSDGDAQGDACDPDDDNDGIPDATDSVPTDPTNPGPFGATNASNIMNGTTGADTMCGLLGDDTINGVQGNDTLYGGACGVNLRIAAAQAAGSDGNDEITGAEGNDSLFGGSGNDTLSGGTGLDQLFGGSGDDTLGGGEGNDKLDGGAGNDKINGGEGRDTLTGGDGKDSLNGGTDRNKYKAGAGNDKVAAANGVRESVDCGAGTDKVTADRTDKVKNCERVKRIK